VRFEFKKAGLDDKVKNIIRDRLAGKIKEMTQVRMQLEEVPHGSLPRFEYKVRRWTDERIEGLERVKYIEKS
jgi:phenylacetate-coenzyme A ligase PaaK-like adenylate-forming protein